MGGIDGPEGARQESAVPGEDQFEGQLVPQEWMAWDNESNFSLTLDLVALNATFTSWQ